MFNSANSTESSIRGPYNCPTSPPPPLPEAVRTWLGENNNTTFMCPMCFRAFTSTQALGGHQNAHYNLPISPPPPASPTWHPLRHYYSRSDDFEAEGERENLSLELTLAVGGSARAGGEERENNLSLELTLAVGGSARAGGEERENPSLELTLAVGESSTAHT